MQRKIWSAFETGFMGLTRRKSSRRLTGELKRQRDGEELTCMDKDKDMELRPGSREDRHSGQTKRREREKKR